MRKAIGCIALLSLLAGCGTESGRLIYNAVDPCGADDWYRKPYAERSTGCLVEELNKEKKTAQISRSTKNKADAEERVKTISGVLSQRGWCEKPAKDKEGKTVQAWQDCAADLRFPEITNFAAATDEQLLRDYTMNKKNMVFWGQSGNKEKHGHFAERLYKDIPELDNRNYCYNKSKDEWRKCGASEKQNSDKRLLSQYWAYYSNGNTKKADAVGDKLISRNWCKREEGAGDDAVWGKCTEKELAERSRKKAVEDKQKLCLNFANCLIPIALASRDERNRLKRDWNYTVPQAQLEMGNAQVTETCGLPKELVKATFDRVLSGKMLPGISADLYFYRNGANVVYQSCMGR